MNIFDTHHHLWDTRALHYTLFDSVPALRRPYLLSGYERVATANQISGSVCVEAASAGADGWKETLSLLDQIKKSRVVKRLVAWAPLDDPNLRAYLERLVRVGGKSVVGVRRSFEFEPPDFPEQKQVIAGAQLVSRFGYLLELVLFERSLASAVRLVSKCPETAFILDHRSRFRYQNPIYQLEYSRNLLFKRGSEMGRVVEALVDRNRTRMDVKRLRMILGRKNRPHHRKKKTAGWQITVETPTYDLTVFKIHCGKVALKIYTKGERVLRAEAMASNAREHRCGRDIGQFATAATKLKEILERFLEALSCVDQCFVSGDVLGDLSASSKIGKTRVSGIDMNSSRMRKVARALLALSVRPGGFTSSQVGEHVREQSAGADPPYGQRQASYDLQKFRGKGLVSRSRGSRRYRMVPEGLRTISAFLLLHDQVLAPLLASTHSKPEPIVAAETTLLDRLHQQLRGTMQEVLCHLGIAA